MYLIMNHPSLLACTHHNIIPNPCFINGNLFRGTFYRGICQITSCLEFGNTEHSAWATPFSPVFSVLSSNTVWEHRTIPSFPLLWEFSLRLSFFSCFCTSIFIINLSIDCPLDHCLDLMQLGSPAVGIVSHSASDVICLPPFTFPIV